MTRQALTERFLDAEPLVVGRSLHPDTGASVRPSHVEVIR